MSGACLSGFASTSQVIIFQVPLLGLHLWPPLKYFWGLPPITNNPKIETPSHIWGSKTTYLAVRRRLSFDAPQPSYVGLSRSNKKRITIFFKGPVYNKEWHHLPGCMAWKCGTHPLQLCSALPLNSGLLMVTLTVLKHFLFNPFSLGFPGSSQALTSFLLILQPKSLSSTSTHVQWHM